MKLFFLSLSYMVNSKLNYIDCKLLIQNHKMFDEEDYYSDQQENVMFSYKHVASSKVLVPSTGSEFNNLTGDGESLFKMMKDRGFDLNQNEIKKMKEHKSRQKSESKPKPKAGFFDGGYKASLQQLVKALNKAFSKADPQQASCILSYILEKKDLSPQNRNKYGIMKCNILFGLGAYQQCLPKAQQLLQKPYNKLSAATLSNLMAKCKSQTGQLLSGYIDYLRSKSLLDEFKQEQKQTKKEQQQGKQTKDKIKNQNQFAENEVDIASREISHTELQYNIKMNAFKNNTNLILPYFPQFRHRKILQVVCGDYHALFLAGQGLTPDKKTKQQKRNTKWMTEVFGVGENSVGQITGKQRQVIYKQPILISELSGKGIEGIWATKQTSLAYNNDGNIYQWGIKQNRNDLIEVTFTVGEQIKKLEKGYKHYALLTHSGKFYSWGAIQMKGANIYTQAKPKMQDSTNIINFSCGDSHTIALDSEGNAYGLGSNQFGQLCMPTQKLAKNFRKINNNMINGCIKKVFALQNSTFFVTEDCQIFFCGRYSYNKQAQDNLRQAQFNQEFNDVISISGNVGIFYVTNESGKMYKWDVDNMVKFKVSQDDNKTLQRYVSSSRSSLYRVRSTIRPEYCEIVRKTGDPRTYEPIYYIMTLRDEYGLYGLTDFILPPKCQIFLSTYKAKEEDLLNENKLFLDCSTFSKESHKILLNQIIEKRLIDSKITRSKDYPWKVQLEIMVETSGRYFFYVILQEKIILQEQLEIQISEREKQLQEKNAHDKKLRQEERRRKAELERQRLNQERLRKEMQEEERRKETQRRAEEALKKHLREQEQAKIRQEQDRREKKELKTGGGYDLTKLAKKNSQQQKNIQERSSEELVKREVLERSEKMDKTGQSFLPDINQRPSSRRKINLPKPSQLISLKSSIGGEKASLKSSVGDFSSTGFTSEKPKTPLRKQQLAQTGVVFKRPVKGNSLVKRGMSKKK